MSYIGPGSFSHIPNLHTIRISNAPLLMNISDNVFDYNFEKLKVLKIFNCGLHQLPYFNMLHSKVIMGEIDLSHNKLTVINTATFRVKVVLLNLQYNLIETIEDGAFYGSEVEHLSFRGNRKLKKLHPFALKGFSSLTELDLSLTEIESLPSEGLQELEVIQIEETHSLKVFPSIYSFRKINIAKLTYPYHCCAFHFPEAHAPEAHAKFIAENEQRYCSQTTSSTNAKETAHLEANSNSVRRRRSGLDVPQWGGATIQEIIRRDDEIHRLPEQYTNWETFTDNVDDYRRVDPAPSDINNSTFWVRPSVGRYTERPPDLQPHHGEGFGNNPFKPVQNPVDVPRPISNIGDFHNASSVHPNEWQLKYCGNISKNYRDVQCSPAPDAFNPCEDVMGNSTLRVAIWFVVIAAIFGNLAVMVVLMSSRFKMTVSKFLMCNLAFADLCMGFYLLIVAAMDIHTMGDYFNYAIYWQEGPGCQVAGFLTVFASELSIFTLTVITLERWYAITYAIHLNKRLRLGAAGRIMVLGWIYALVFATFPLVGVSSYAKTSICLPMENQDVTDLAYLLSLLTINGLAFVLICCCYAKMYWSISSQHSTVTQNDMTVAKRMAMLVFTDFACWAPIAFFGLTAVAGYPLINVTNSKILLVFFYPLNSCANPFLYAILTKQYRRDLFVLLSRFGLFKQRASKYKPNYSSNTHTNQRTTASSSLQRAGSLWDAMRRRRNSPDVETPKNTPPTPSKVKDPSRINNDLFGNEGGRRLSIVRENSHTSEEDLAERVSSPLHKGSPHPIKNSYTKLNTTAEQEQMLQRMLAFDKHEGYCSTEMLPLTDNGSPASSHTSQPHKDVTSV